MICRKMFEKIDTAFYRYQFGYQPITYLRGQQDVPLEIRCMPEFDRTKEKTNYCFCKVDYVEA